MANSMVGMVRGGMSLALILSSAFFAALSGSAPATQHIFIKETFPREKICGDAYVASLFPDFFDEMGISEEMISHAAAPLLEILLHDPAEESALFKMDSEKRRNRLYYSEKNWR